MVGALMIAILVFALILLQQQFDQGDYRRALQMLAVKPAGSSRSAFDEMLARAGNRPVDCQPKLLSSFAGTLEITCTTGEPEPYRFGVDLVRKQLLPKDGHTADLMAAARGPGPAARTPDGGPL